MSNRVWSRHWGLPVLSTLTAMDWVWTAPGEPDSRQPIWIAPTDIDAAAKRRKDPSEEFFTKAIDCFPSFMDSLYVPIARPKNGFAYYDRSRGQNQSRRFLSLKELQWADEIWGNRTGSGNIQDGN